MHPQARGHGVVDAAPAAAAVARRYLDARGERRAPRRRRSCAACCRSAAEAALDRLARGAFRQGTASDGRVHRTTVRCASSRSAPARASSRHVPVCGDVTLYIPRRVRAARRAAIGTVEFHNASTCRARLTAGDVGGLRLRRAQVAHRRHEGNRRSRSTAQWIGRRRPRRCAVLQDSPLGPADSATQFMQLSGRGPADFTLRLHLPTQDVQARDYLVRTKLRSVTVDWPVLRAPATASPAISRFTTGRFARGAARHDPRRPVRAQRCSPGPTRRGRDAHRCC